MRSIVPFATLLALLAVAPLASAQGYPSKPLRIIVPVTAGGAVDTVARALVPTLGQSLGQPIVVDNRPGASGIIGLSACAKSAPDGYTVCLTNSDSISFGPLLHSNLPYSPSRDLAPVIQIAFIDTVMTSSALLPVSSMRELIDLAIAKPGTIAWSSFGNGSIGHLYIEWLRNTTGAVFNHVPYKGAAPALTAVVGGEVQVSMVSLGQAIPVVRSGRLRALALSGSRRSALMPDVPTFEELGLDLQVRPWLGMFAPAETPVEIIRRLNAEIAKILRDPKFREQQLTARALDPAGESPEEFAGFLKADRERAAKLVKIAGVKPD